MAKQDLTRVYNGSDLSGATTGVIYLPIVRGSLLEKVSVRSDAVQSGAAVFEVRLNGSVITGLSALTIVNGTKVGTVSGLSVGLVDGDEIVLNLLSGNVSAPVTINLATDDGESSGPSLPDGGTIGQALVKASATDGDAVWADNGTSIGGDVVGVLTNSKVEKIQNIPVKSYAAGFLADNFNDNSLDTIWQKVAPSSTTEVDEINNHIEIDANATVEANGLQLVGWKDFTNQFFTIEVVQPSSGSAGTYLGLVDSTDNRYLLFEIKSGHIAGYVYYGGETSGSFGTVDYSNTTHRFLKIQHNSITGKITWLTSSTGINGSWTVLADYSIGAFTINNCRVRPMQVNGSGGSTAVAIFDNFTSSFPTAPTDIPDGALMSYKAAENQIEFISIDDLKVLLGI